MKNSTIIPLIGLTAALAFGVGWITKPISEGGENLVISNRTSDRSTEAFRAGRSAGDQGGPASQFVGRFLVNGKISPEDMRAAIKELSEVNDPLLRQKMFAELLENLTAENAKDAFLALYENRGGGSMGRGRDQEMGLLANVWGRIDGAGAMAALKEIAENIGDDDRRGGRGGRRPGRLGGEMIGALSGWATVDSAGAMAYLDTLEAGREKGMAGFGVLQGLLVNGVDDAMSFVQGLSADGTDGRAKEMYMGMIAEEMLEQGVDSAKSWVDSISDLDLKSGALTRLTMELMQGDREETAAWLLQYGGDDAAAGAVNRFTDSWSRDDPEAVLEWADQLTGKPKAEAYEEAMESWTREDPIAAGEYLATLPASAARDAATGAFAERVSREDPETAMEWAGTISDLDLRNETIIEVAQDWYRSDRAATETWMQTSGLSAEVLAQITSRDRGGDRGGDRGRRGGR